MVDTNAAGAVAGRSEASALRTWYLTLPALPLLAATVSGALAGGGLLHIATRLPNALVGLAGVVLATLCAWVTTDYTSARWREPDSGRWKVFVVSCGVAGLALVIVSELASWPFPAFAGLMGMTIGAGPIVAEVRDDADASAERWMLGGLALSLVATLLLAVRSLPGWMQLAAIVAVLVGFGFFTGGLSAHCAAEASTTGTDSDGLPSSRVLRILPGDAEQRGLAAAGIGIAVTIIGVVLGALLVVLLGGWLVLVAMIVLSVRPRRFGLSVTMQWTIFVAGLGLVVVAGYQLFTTDAVGRSVSFLAFVVLTIALAGAWIVWRGATLFIAVLVGFAFVWGLFSRTTFDDGQVSSAPVGEVSRDVAPTRGVVAFGDSFISGEGAPRFFVGTDQRGDDQNECRRAPTAYPALIALRGGDPIGEGPDGEPLDPIVGLSNDGLDFYACSGAKLAQVLDTTPEDGRPDNDGRDLPCEPDDPLAVGQYPCGPAGVYGSRLQIDHLPDVVPGTVSGTPAGNGDATPAETIALADTQLVLVSIGGNDVRFGDIVAGCLLPGSCAERREVWLDNVTALGPELTTGYSQLRERFDPDGDGSTAVVVMPYPLVLTEDTCDGSPLDGSEHEFIYEFTTVLNQQLAASAAQAGVHFFADGPFAFDGHRLCEEGDPAINLIALQPSDGPLTERLNPGSWTHNSMHPNPLGHQLTAQALTQWLNAGAILTEPHPDPDPTATTELLGVRTARPYAVAPSTLRQLGAAPVGGCDFEQLASFATRIAVFDEQPSDGEEQPFRVPVAGADPTATICATDAQGDWVTLTPTEGGDDMNMASEQPTASIQDGRVFVTGGRPAPGCPPDEQDDGVCAYQWILFAPPVEAAAVGDDAGDDAGANGADADPSERVWSLRAVRYCSTDPDCESTFGEWIDAQIETAARKVIPPVALIFLGGWLLALGWRVLENKPVPDRLRRWWSSAIGVLSTFDPLGGASAESSARQRDVDPG